MISKNNPSLTLVFLGPSGSGKGTQATLIKDKFDFEFIEMGGIIREEAKKDTDFGKEVNQIVMVEGGLLPDHMSFKLLQGKVLAVSSEKNLIIDGYPRSLGQVKDLSALLEKAGRKKLTVFNVTLSDEKVLKRLAKRLICESCKMVYVADSKIEEGSDCVKCSGKLIRRADDTPAKIKERLKWAHEKVDPAIAEYRRRGLVIDIDGSRSIEEVNRELEKYVEELLSQ